MLILILKVEVSILIIKNVDVAMIDININCITCKWKKAQIFVILIKDLEYQI